LVRILIVDDDNAVISFLKRKIEALLQDCECITANDFGEVLIITSSEKFDLIIIDNILSYPGEGEDLAKQLLFMPLNCHAEIWIISGDFEKEEKKANYTFLPKPISAEKESIFNAKLTSWV